MARQAKSSIFKTFLKNTPRKRALLLLPVILGGLFLVSKYVSSHTTSSILSTTARSTKNIDAIKEREHWTKRIDEIGAEPAYAEFKTEYASDHFGVQHYVAHIMGEVLYEKEGIKGLAICDSTFAFGCYHSFFGRALGEKNLAILPELNQACLDRYGPLGTGCLHGIGHGLLDYLGQNHLAEALNACLSTTQKNPLFGCTSGVFMEYNVPIIITTDSAHTEFRKLNPTNPHEPCTEVLERFRKSCYYEMGQWWDKVYFGDYKKMGSLCQEVSNPEYKEPCYLGIGNVSAPSSDYNVAETIKKCQQMPDAASELICRSGASWSFYAEPKKRSLAPLVCQGLGQEIEKNCVTRSDLIGERKSE
jgi:hypothetical protein